MNPLEVLLPALYLALNTPALEWAGQPVPAEQNLPGPTAGHYVLLDQPTDADAGGATSCAHFTCTVLLQVVTQFAADAVSSRAAESLASQIHARLRGQRLDLGAEWDCQPGTVSTLEAKGLPGELLTVRRLLRYRWEVYHHTPAPIPPVVSAGLDYVLSGPDGSFRLA